MENSSGRKLKAIRTDNGGEYTSTVFENYLKPEGIRQERTIPKTPQQNGVAERMNRTLVETVHTMLTDAKLPHKYWGALSTAIYLRNQSPTKAVTGMTPCEAWTTKKPSVAHLRVFSCDAYAHVPKNERGKLDPKAKKCVFVGYGEETKGYRLYDPVCAKIIFSRDVVFNEGKCGGSGSEDVTQYVESELSSDDTPMTLELSQVEPQEERLIPLSTSLHHLNRQFDNQHVRGKCQTTSDRRQTSLEAKCKSHTLWRQYITLQRKLTG